MCEVAVDIEIVEELLFDEEDDDDEEEEEVGSRFWLGGEEGENVDVEEESEEEEEGEGEGGMSSSVDVLGLNAALILRTSADDLRLIPNHLVNHLELIFLLICSSISLEMVSLSRGCPKKSNEQIAGSTTTQG